MFLDVLEIPVNAYKVAALHRWGGNFAPEWWQFKNGMMAVLHRIMQLKFTLGYKSPN
jgi:hypothetical protein